MLLFVAFHSIKEPAAEWEGLDIVVISVIMLSVCFYCDIAESNSHGLRATEFQSTYFLNWSVIECT